METPLSLEVARLLPAELQDVIWRVYFSSHVLVDVEQAAARRVFKGQIFCRWGAYCCPKFYHVVRVRDDRPVIKLLPLCQDGWGNFWARTCDRDEELSNSVRHPSSPDDEIVCRKGELQVFYAKRSCESWPMFSSLGRVHAAMETHDRKPRWPERLVK